MATNPQPESEKCPVCGSPTAEGTRGRWCPKCQRSTIMYAPQPEPNTAPPPAGELSNANLVQTLIECYARSFMYPNSELIHARWVECKTEVLRRLATPPADRYVLGDAIRRAFLKHGHDAWCSIADDVIAEMGAPALPVAGEDAPPTFKGVVCRGDYRLGTACGKCERCVWYANRRLGGAIYVASRASLPERGAMWRKFRSEGVRITSTWIDEDGAGQTEDWSELWLRISNEIQASDALVLYAEKDDFPLKGALIEVGIALGLQRPVIVCLPGVVLPSNFRPIGSWINHPLVTRVDDIDAAVRLAAATPPAPAGEAVTRETVWDEAIEIVRKAETANKESYEYWKHLASDQKDMGVMKFICYSGEDSRIIAALTAARDAKDK